MLLKKLGAATIIYGLGGVLNRGVSLLLLPLLTQFLDKKAYGVSGLLQIISFFIIPIFSMGLGSSLSACYFKHSNEKDRQASVMSAVLLMSISAGILLLVCLPSAGWLAANYLGDRKLSTVVEMAAITNALILVCQPLVLQIQFADKSRIFVALSIITSLVTSVVIVIAVVNLKLGLAGWIGGQMVGQLISLVAYGVYFLRHDRGSIKWPVLRELVYMGIPLIPSFLFIYIITQGNRYFIERFWGVEELGVFSVASSIAAAVSLAVTAFQNAWTPFFMSYRNDINAARIVFGEVTSWYLLGMGVCAVAFFCFAQPIMALMTEQSFHSGWIVIGTVATAYILTGATNLLAPAQYFSGKIWHLSIIQAIAAVCSVVINWLLIRSGGLLGAGSALALSFLALFIIHAVWNHMDWSMSLPINYNWSRILTVWCAVFVVAVLTIYFPASSIGFGLARGFALNFGFLVGMVILLSERERTSIKSMIMELLYRQRR